MTKYTLKKEAQTATEDVSNENECKSASESRVVDTVMTNHIGSCKEHTAGVQLEQI